MYSCGIASNGRVDVSSALAVSVAGCGVERNAVDAIGESGHIIIYVQENANTVYIDISDSGKGIPKSLQKTIFSPGFTTKNRGWG